MKLKDFIKEEGGVLAFETDGVVDSTDAQIPTLPKRVRKRLRGVDISTVGNNNFETKRGRTTPHNARKTLT